MVTSSTELFWESQKEIEETASKLNSMEPFSSHGEGINFKQAHEIGLNVKSLHDEKELEDAVLSIYHTASIIFEQTTIQKIIANHIEKRYIVKYSLHQNQ